MRRDPRIINLYDRPLYSRPSAASHRNDAPGFSSHLLACATIVALTGGFFWLYDIVAHREPPFVPAFTQSAAASAYPSAAPSRTNTRQDAPQRPVKSAEAPRRIKKIGAVKRIPEEATQAFALGLGFARSPPE